MTPDRRASQRGWVTLIELLVVVVIIFIMGYLFMSGGGPFGSKQVEEELGPARPGGPQSIPGRSIEAAKSVECQNNLSQIRHAIRMHAMETDKPPAGLSELGLPAATLKCPVTGDPYTYDARTGGVNCVVPGHEKY